MSTLLSCAHFAGAWHHVLMRSWCNSGMSDANPDAVTQLANGLSTTSMSYDNDGNLTSAGTSTFSWDYNNRMTQAVTAGSATSTYTYDYAGNRVSQVVGSATTVYPNKFYSITSTTNGATTYATSTVYVWNGDTLIATIDQPLVNGVATGTAAMRYIYPDNLGSTNIVSDESGNIVADYENYPYGETRLNQTTYPTKENRRFIGQFSDANNLQYLNARYLNSQQGQFLSEDPVFFLGDPSQQNLQDPQSLNTYSYANDNPITKSDPTGKCIICAGLEILYSGIAQATYDSAFGRSSPAVYGGDVVGAAMYGYAYPYAIAFPEPVAAVSAAAGNAAQQGFEYLSGDRTSFDVSQTQIAGTAAVGAQYLVANLPIPIISGSALSKQTSGSESEVAACR